jgi:transcriptional regulator with XRE-family HTH domain
MDKMDIDPFYKHIGMTLRGAREALSMTQAELAQVVGLSRTSLTNIELGRQRILVDQLAELANALHISVSSLIPERSTATVTEDNSQHLECLPAVTDFLNAVRSHDKAA